MLEAMQEKSGRPCPRMVVHPENLDAWMLLNLGLDVDHQGFVAGFGSGLASHYERDDYRRLYARVRAVRSDETFRELLEELRERHEERGDRGVDQDRRS